MIVPATGYKIEGHTDQALGFSKAFICLYTPILGTDASVLYQYLLVQSQTIGTHHQFMQHFGWSLSHLEKSREKLEALQLLETYLDGDVVVYSLKTPLAYTQFFTHPLFSALLLKTVGQAHYTLLEHEYAESERDLTKLTKSFSDVFGKIEPLGVKEVQTEQLKAEMQFDWELFDALVAKSFIRLKTIEANRAMIASKAYVFQKSEEEMARLVIENYNVQTHEIDRNKLEASIMVPTKATKLEPKTSQVTDESDVTKLAQFFETTSPQQFLQARFGHVSKNDLRVIDMCMSQFQFSRGVTNVLIDYVLNTNDQKLTRAYVETIASQLYRKKVTTALDAIRHFLSINEAKKQPTTKPRSNFSKQAAPKPHQEMIDFDAVETKKLSEAEKAKFLEEYGDDWNENA